MDLRDLLPAERAVEDILAARIRLTGVTLPVLPVADARTWMEHPAFGPAAHVLRSVAAESDDPEWVLTVLAAMVRSDPEAYVAFLRAYDLADRLPDRKRLAKTWTALDVLQACLEVWRAAHPVSRHKGKVLDDRTPGERLAAAYERAAAEWGIAPMALEVEMTDEQLVLLMDAAVDRRRSAFEDAVEASRMGALFAKGKSGAKAYEKWARKMKRKASLTGQALEHAVGAFAFSHPEYVVEGPR